MLKTELKCVGFFFFSFVKPVNLYLKVLRSSLLHCQLKSVSNKNKEVNLQLALRQFLTKEYLHSKLKIVVCGNIWLFVRISYSFNHMEIVLISFVHTYILFRCFYIWNSFSF